ncbi:hypothetical protein BX070DRAFT_182234, partial [Coemansia spiralis]
LSVMSVNLLTPALLFSKMTETLDPSLLVELWNEPLFYFIYGGFSLLWSRVGCRILKINKEYARLCDVATFFSNTNTLPVSLIKSIALSAGSHFLLKDADDTPLKVAARGVSYAMIFATLNNILRWSFGVALMGGMDSKNKSAFNSLCSAVRGAQKIWNSIQSCITPPVYAITAAFIVIIIEPLHKAFMDQNHVLYTIWSAIDMCGDACVPLILISLGGQLGVIEIAEQSISAAEQRKGIVLVLVGRFVFVPTLAVILLTTLRVMFPALLPIMANDPVYMLTLLILSSTPPAINLITVSQATGKFETEAAQILFYGY